MPETARQPRGEPHDGPFLGDFVCFSIYSASLAFNRVYKPLLAEMGLTYPQYLVMVVLWEGDDRTVGGIGEVLSLDSSTLTPLLKRLEGMGHLTRARDSHDERVVRVRLTPAGRNLRLKARVVPGCILEATGMSMDELRRLQGEIDALRRNLEAANG
ncbi:MarR family winged helix-turn-helix transcriptional regulator [Blastochloris sulfoviridis]|uniref:Winged helix-turn-helix transcriptional regulator n=1 Tax=Blastochloris sulfoviridis TaxID=50712 RepID=A0A5M6I230_9HYPH|nr:MarR family winged helix-turn-helix transcriptional regulator [Blastochloris sulfoviridis]KAA5602254.1 winged helix-turn-helix transcriptional regulator [Blastochloris sulfoviridis]